MTIISVIFIFLAAIVFYIIYRNYYSWEDVWEDYGMWNTTVYTDFGTEKELNRCDYVIRRHRRKGYYKLFVYGYKPYSHDYCTIALRKLIELKNSK